MDNKRISIIGTTCTGKSTLARRLADAHGIPYVELDAIYWLPGWRNISDDEFRKKAEAFIRDDAWVIDGNYGSVRGMVWERATTIVWLDLPFMTILWRLIKRTLKRVITKEELFSGNRETFTAQFLSKDSLFVWFFRSYAKNKRRYGNALRELAGMGKDIVVLRSSHDVEKFIESVITE